MDLTGIIAISGKPGLFKVITQGKNSIIVESLTDNKRIPAYATDRISALDDISIYTYEEDKPLREVFSTIFEKESGKETLSHKEDLKKLESYLLEVLPNFDRERVYQSDIKKIFQWYNMLLTSGNLKPIVSEETPVEKPAKKAKAAKDSASSSTEDAEETTKTPTKKPAAKKATTAAKPKVTAAPAKTPAKPSTGAKKVATVKTGGGRGK